MALGHPWERYAVRTEVVAANQTAEDVHRVGARDEAVEGDIVVGAGDEAEDVVPVPVLAQIQDQDLAQDLAVVDHIAPHDGLAGD